MVRTHLNPYFIPNSSSPSGYNSPDLWYSLAVFPFLAMKHIIYFGIGVGVALLFSLWMLLSELSLVDSLEYTLIILSPAVLLGVDRGDCDVIIFILLIVSAKIYKLKIMPVCMLMLSGLLKSFPVGAAIIILLEGEANTRTSIKKLAWDLFLFSAYFIFFISNMKLKFNQTQKPFHGMCSGLGLIPSSLVFHFHWGPSNKLIMFICAISVGFYLFFHYFYDRFANLSFYGGFQKNAYMIGSRVFITICLIGYNWKYHLIFLSLTFPQLLDWIRNEDLSVFVMMAISILLSGQYLFWQDRFPCKGEFRILSYDKPLFAGSIAICSHSYPPVTNMEPSYRGQGVHPLNARPSLPLPWFTLTSCV